MNFTHSAMGQGRVELTNRNGGNLALHFRDVECLYLVTRLSNGMLNFGLRQAAADKEQCPKGQFARAADDNKLTETRGPPLQPVPPAQSQQAPSDGRLTVKQIIFEPAGNNLGRSGRVVFSFSSMKFSFEVTTPFDDATSPAEAVTGALKELRGTAQSLSDSALRFQIQP
ncbi:hypothetical protein [Microvirga lotononidis]|nr:hypothetical protein [Microvirga lotononidis]WQO31382.1 hypothetical protein U0023_34420 [Microvirga lotononidis]